MVVLVDSIESKILLGCREGQIFVAEACVGEAEAGGVVGVVILLCRCPFYRDLLCVMTLRSALSQRDVVLSWSHQDAHLDLENKLSPQRAEHYDTLSGCLFVCKEIVLFDSCYMPDVLKWEGREERLKTQAERKKM